MRLISLVDAELDDTGDIARSDFNLIRTNLGPTKLIDGDVDFDGKVDINDLTIMSGHWLGVSSRWGFGDLDASGTIDINDLTILSGHWLENLGATGQPSTIPGPAFADALASVGLAQAPEPAGLGVLGLGVLFLKRRGRRRRM
jgi:hypothetical protein